ncbi:SCO-spondin-like [Dermacentor albipictus]|uniref:SCO-spondin-like n=1 Tax=Dermacentor albipictus TaxID=60249 RepID=UPI0038FCFC33
MGSCKHGIGIAIAAICIVVANGQEQFGPRQCGCLEEPVNGAPRRDRFCRPKWTLPSELNRIRHCVCRPGLIRNSWGDCITQQECKSCKCFWDRDFNVCTRACPLICNEPIRSTCPQHCVFGCDCPPGYIRSSSGRRKSCVKIDRCPPRCPPNSIFQTCVSTCAPKCGKPRPTNCATLCQRGGCVCNQGYAEVEQDGQIICVPEQDCARYGTMPTPFQPTGPGNVDHGGGSFGTSYRPGGDTAPQIPAPIPGAGVPPRGAEGMFPQGGPTYGSTGYSPGGISMYPQGTPPQGTTVNRPGGVGTFPQSVPSMGPTQNQPSGSVIFQGGSISPVNNGYLPISSAGTILYPPISVETRPVVSPGSNSGYQIGRPCFSQSSPCTQFSTVGVGGCRQCQ